MQGKPHLEFPGDFTLKNPNDNGVVLVNSVGERQNLTLGTIAELNIFEDIESNAVIGTMHIMDAYNIISNASLQGNERLIFKLSTPGTTNDKVDIVDASEETGYPFHIHGLTDRIQQSETLMTYTLHFSSKELIRNVRTRVSRAYNGGLAQSVVDILRDESGLNSRKDIYYEETRNQDKVVIPNLRPFDAINMISRKALSKNANGAGYYFYETTKGFHFRSYESMLAYKSKYARPVILTLVYQPKIIGTSSDRKFMNQHGIDSFEFMQHFDVLGHQATGTYANRVITHNIYDKSYNVKDYHYHNQFANMFHTDEVDSASKRNYPISDTPVDLDPKEGAPGDKTVSDYPNSLVSLQSSTRFLHGENTGVFGTDPDSEGLTEATRISQENQIQNSTRVKITMPGHSYLQAGDVIDFRLPSNEPNKGDKKGYQFDEYHSGRYVVVKLRHRVIRGMYKMVLECIKDSVYRKHTNLPNESFPGKQSPQGKTQDIYLLDEFQTAKPSFLS